MLLTSKNNIYNLKFLYFVYLITFHFLLKFNYLYKIIFGEFGDIDFIHGNTIKFQNENIILSS